MEIKNLKKAAQRILKAIKNKERIILYGDADLDGVASIIILKESIKNLGGQVAKVYFPDREKEGYGLNQKALNLLKKISPALLILLDCGISNFKEIKLAKKLGLEVIIIDHHEILDKLPQAEIIVDPKQPGDKYPFKEPATAGIVFKLSELLFAKKFSQQLKASFLELTALATISDMMPQINDNKILIEKGLDSLKGTFRPGLKVFHEIDNNLNYRPPERREREEETNSLCPPERREGEEETNSLRPIKEIAQRIISALNSGETKEHQNTAYLLLTSGDKKTAEILAKVLLEKSYQKQTRIKEITQELEERVLRKTGEIIVFEGSIFWQLSLLGPAASRICQKLQKPTFIFKKGSKESSGTARTPPNINGVEAMKSCSKILKTFGGHPLAAGFAIRNENLGKFRECLMKYFSKL